MFKSQMRNKKMRSGFTMIEVIFVIVILAILFGGVVKMVAGQGDTAETNNVISEINRDVSMAAARFKQDYYLAGKKYTGANAETFQMYLATPSNYVLTGTGDTSKLSHVELPGYFFQVLPDIHNTTNSLRYKIYFDGAEAKTSKMWSNQQAQQIESTIANYFQNLYPTAVGQVAGGATAIGAANTNVTPAIINNDLKVAVGKCGM